MESEELNSRTHSAPHSVILSKLPDTWVFSLTKCTHRAKMPTMKFYGALKSNRLEHSNVDESENIV